MRVLVTGANGFLGSWLVKYLLNEGHEVRAFVRPQSDRSFLTGLSCSYAFGDILDLENLRLAMKDVDAVFHLAAFMMSKPSERELLERVNVLGTQNVVSLCQQLRIPRLVHVSSVVALGARTSDSGFVTEENSCEINLANMQSKRRGEEIVRTAVRERKIDAVIVNPSLIYGPGDARKKIRQGSVLAAQGKMKFYTSGGVNVVAVEDVVHGLLLAWKKGRNGENYILSGENITLKDLFSWIAEEAGVRPPRFHLPDWILISIAFVSDKLRIDSPLNSDTVKTILMYHWCDSAKARRELGFRFRPAREAVKASVHWMREQGYLGECPKNFLKHHHQVVLLDLDGTLLQARPGLFLMANVILIYFRMAPVLGWRRVLKIFNWAMRSVFQNKASSGRTNFEILFQELADQSGKNRKDLEESAWKFYQKDFPRLRSLCRPVKGAAEAVRAIKDSGRKIYLTTNPIWPKECVLKRLEWAGIDFSDFEGLTHSQNWSSCKPHLSYYEDVLARWNLEPEQCLLIGDTEKKEGPARQIGIDVALLPSRNKVVFWRQVAQDARGDRRLSGGIDQNKASS